jgi:hypothetical protein
VAYNYLADRDPVQYYPPLQVPRFVTFGSMIGVQEVYQALFGSMVQPPLTWPTDVASWVNVTAALDPLAFPLTGMLRFPNPTVSLRDRLTASPARVLKAHDAAGYLSDPVTARAIAFAWCAAMRAPGRPAGCSGLTDVP